MNKRSQNSSNLSSDVVDKEKVIALPKCSDKTGTATSDWTDCIGTSIHPRFGSKWVGEYKDGKRTGQGTATNTQGDKYVGEFRENKFHGKGTMTYANGRVEKGSWEDGEFVGN